MTKHKAKSSIGLTGNRAKGDNPVADSAARVGITPEQAIKALRELHEKKQREAQ